MKAGTQNIKDIQQVIKQSLVILFLLLPKAIVPQEKTEEYQVKAVFLYNFSRFVDWPATSFSSSNSPFVIGILGDDPFGNYLEEAVKGEMVGSHVMTIHHLHSISDAENCHILFINYKDTDILKKTINALNGKNVLTVNESSNFAKLGGMVQLYTESNKIKLMINDNAVKGTQLQISSKLMRVARVY